VTDTLVIGGGVNGLTAASYLARAGRKVTVLETRDRVGGIASVLEFAPGFRAPIGPENAGLLLPRVIDELELERHGLELLDLDAFAFAPHRDGRDGKGLLLSKDVSRSVEEIRKYSTRDAEAYPRFVALVDAMAEFLKPLLSKPAPTPEIETGSDLMELLKLGWGFRTLGTRTMHELLRVLPMSIQDFLSEWFESDLLKATLAAPALESVCLGPRSAGTSALFLYQRLGPRRAARGLGSSLRKALESRGGSVRTEARVGRILVENERAVGVTLESGEEIRAPLVLSALAPRVTFRELMDPSLLPPSYVSEIDRIRYRGVTAKLFLAVSAIPELHRAPAYVGDSLDDLERAYDASKYGRFAERPSLTVSIPSQIDPSLAPSGKHVVTVIAQTAPYRLRDGTWSESKAALTETILERLAESVPDVKSSILHQHLMTPEDYERELGLPEGNWHQGEMALDQMFFMRPVPGWSRYETPIQGLYLCGGSTHPGGGITGACGYNAAHRARKV
jgi:phytoene dehydrogenase-like protein